MLEHAESSPAQSVRNRPVRVSRSAVWTYLSGLLACALCYRLISLRMVDAAHVHERQRTPAAPPLPSHSECAGELVQHLHGPYK